MPLRFTLIHGANGVPAGMEPLSSRLRPSVDLFLPTLLGHGGRALPDRFTVAALAADVVAQLDRAGIERTAIGGYSFGGVVALSLARHHPARITAVATLATRVFFDADAVRHFVHLTEPARLGRPGNPRKDQLAAEHHPHEWSAVPTRTRALFATLGASPPLDADDLRAIAAPAFIVSGERDPLAPAAETDRIAARLRDARTWIFPGRAHPLRHVPLPGVANAIVTWLEATAAR